MSKDYDDSPLTPAERKQMELEELLEKRAELLKDKNRFTYENHVYRDLKYRLGTYGIDIETGQKKAFSFAR